MSLFKSVLKMYAHHKRGLACSNFPLNFYSQNCQTFVLIRFQYWVSSSQQWISIAHDFCSSVLTIWIRRFFKELKQNCWEKGGMLVNFDKILEINKFWNSFVFLNKQEVKYGLTSRTERNLIYFTNPIRILFWWENLIHFWKKCNFETRFYAVVMFMLYYYREIYCI